jgi:hypothetical protein
MKDASHNLGLAPKSGHPLQTGTARA